MHLLEIISRLSETDNVLELFAGLFISVLFGLQYKKLSGQQKRDEAIRTFLND